MEGRALRKVVECAGERGDGSTEVGEACRAHGRGESEVEGRVPLAGVRRFEPHDEIGEGGVELGGEIEEGNAAGGDGGEDVGRRGGRGAERDEIGRREVRRGGGGVVGRDASLGEHNGISMAYGRVYVKCMFGIIMDLL